METINFLLNFQPIAYDCPAVDVRDVINQSSESAATLYQPPPPPNSFTLIICYLKLRRSASFTTCVHFFILRTNWIELFARGTNGYVSFKT